MALPPPQPPRSVQTRMRGEVGRGEDRRTDKRTWGMEERRRDERRGEDRRRDERTWGERRGQEKR